VKLPFSRSDFVENLIERSIGIYRSILWIYPEGYRDEYGLDLVQAFRDLSREVSDMRSLIVLWVHLVGDLLASAWTEQLDVRRNAMELWKRVLAGVGTLLLAIPLLFVGLNVLEYEMGIAVPWNPFNSLLDSASGLVRIFFEGMIIFGPLLAIGAFLLPNVQFRWKPSEDEIAAIGIRRVSGLSLVLTALSVLVLLILGIYLVGENLP
jgi:hypothetical protein